MCFRRQSNPLSGRAFPSISNPDIFLPVRRGGCFSSTSRRDGTPNSRHPWMMYNLVRRHDMYSQMSKTWMSRTSDGVYTAWNTDNDSQEQRLINFGYCTLASNGFWVCKRRRNWRSLDWVPDDARCIFAILQPNILIATMTPMRTVRASRCVSFVRCAYRLKQLL